MSLLDDIRRKAGTPGPWWFDEMSGDVCDGNNTLNVIAERLSNNEDARRIARVPDMEDALMAAEELAGVALRYVAIDASDKELEAAALRFRAAIEQAQ